MTRILVVGKQSHLVEFLLSRFGQRGDVVGVEGWDGYLEAVSAIHPSVVIMDCSIPGVESRSLADEARQILSPRTCLLLRSSMPEAELRYRVQAVGANGFLLERFGQQEIVARVEEAVRSAGSLQVQLSMPLTALTSRRRSTFGDPGLPEVLETELAWQEEAGEPPWLPRVLLVEQRVLRRRFLLHWLESRGFTKIQDQTGGEQALKSLRKANEAELPDLVLSDLETPAGEESAFGEVLEMDERLKGIERVFYSSLSAPREDASRWIRDRHFLDVVHFDRLERHLSQRIRSMQTRHRLRQVRDGLVPR